MRGAPVWVFTEAVFSVMPEGFIKDYSGRLRGQGIGLLGLSFWGIQEFVDRVADPLLLHLGQVK